MHNKFRTCAWTVRYFLLGYLSIIGVPTAHAAVSPQNAYGLSVDYTIRAAAGTLQVNLMDAIHGNGLAGVRIIAHEIRADGLAYGAGEQTTDRSGRATFTLKRLGRGGRYYLKAYAWHGQPVYTQTITRPGIIVWKTGHVRVRVQNATLAKPVPLANYEVVLRRSDRGWGIRLTTDSKGTLRFDPPGLDKRIRYELVATSPLGGDREVSDPIRTAGTYTFQVGNRPLVVTLRQGTSNKALAGRKIIVRERLSNGSDARVTAGTTNQAGRVAFELDRLGRGGHYILMTNPFDAGWAKSELITTTGNHEFRVGSTPVTLIDADSGKRLAGRKLVAFTVAADKSLARYAVGQTNATGTVFFDFPAVKSGTVFGIRADDPLGNGEHFYSTLIREQGPLQLRIREGTSERLDRTDPLVSIVSPLPGKSAAAGGFVLQGRASDDRKIDRVTVEIRSGGKIREAKALYNPSDHRWSLYVTPETLAGGNTAIITATAIDATNNRQATTVTYPVVEDKEEPKIRFLSYRNGGAISVEGFTLKGTVRDNVAVHRLHIRVEDLNGRRLVPLAEVELVPGSRRWAHNLFPRRWRSRVLARIVVIAEDDNGNRKELAINVTPQVTSRNHRRMIDRITFGATPALVQQSRAIGWINFLETQLAPEQIDDSVLQRMLGSTREIRAHDLVWRTLQRMLYSKRQLLELMTWFWDNHFNTDLRASNSVLEYRENKAFRKHALGHFRDLLEVSAKSPTMLRYLNSSRSNKRNPNENYARELMELHTLGVNGGYMQRDIEELARVFTGWHVQDDHFVFRSKPHDPGDKQFMGALIRGSGLREGEEVLDILASHPSTARFICEKLVRFFISDPVDTSLVAGCAKTFSNTGGDIRAVLRRILKSQPFYDAVANNTRFKSPLRFTTGVVRALGVTADRHTLVRALDSMGMSLYRNPMPTGWPVSGNSWINANQLVQRTNLLLDLFDKLRDEDNFSLVDRAVSQNNVTDAGILGMFMDDYFARRMTYTEYQEVFGELNDPSIFSVEAADAEGRLRHALRTMLAFPASHVY